MPPKDGLKCQPAAEDPSPGLCGLPGREGSASPIKLPTAIFPLPNGDCNSVLLQAAIPTRGFDTNGNPLAGANSSWPTFLQHASDSNRLHSNSRPVVRSIINHSPCPQRCILLGRNEPLPVRRQRLLMVATLPDEVLHSDRHIAQRTDSPASMGVCTEAPLRPSIHRPLEGAFELFHDSMIRGPIRPPHHRETMLELLDALGPLHSQLLMQLLLQVRPWIFDIQLHCLPDPFCWPHPVIKSSCIPLHVYQVRLQCCHGPCHHHPRMCSRDPPRA